MIIDPGDEAVAEELVLISGDVEVMLDVARRLLQIEGFEVEADGDALVEGLVGGEAEFVGQVRLTEQDQGDEGGRVHLAVEEEAQLVEQFGRQQVGLVDDKEHVAALAGQVVERSAELGQEAHEAKGRFYLEGEQDFAVEGADAEMGIGQVDDGIDVAVQGLGEGAGGGGFSGADVAGEEGGRAVLEGKGQAALSLAVAVRGVEVLGSDRLGERGLLKAIELIEIGLRIPPGRVGCSECPGAVPGAGVPARCAA